MDDLDEALSRLRQGFPAKARPASELRALATRRRRRRVRLRIGACAVGLLLVGLAVAAVSTAKGNDTQQVVAAEAFRLPVSDQAPSDRTLVYATQELGSEETDPAGNVLKPAQLVDRRYRFTVSRNGDWAQEQIGGPRPWTRSEFSRGVYRVWEDGLLISDERLSSPIFPHRALVPVAVEQLEAAATDGNFDLTSTQQQGQYTLQRYERQIPKPDPDSEYLHSLPWRESGNSEVMELKFSSQTGHLALMREYLNGTLTSSFEVDETSS
jgi:hypothetical protein